MQEMAHSRRTQDFAFPNTLKSVEEEGRRFGIVLAGMARFGLLHLFLRPASAHRQETLHAEGFGHTVGDEVACESFIRLCFHGQDTFSSFEQV